MRRKIAPFIWSLALACEALPQEPNGAWAQPIELGAARAIAEACPLAAPGDAASHEACGQRLAEAAELREHMVEPFLWGVQPDGLALEEVPERADLIEVNPLVWRRTYLSTFMFEGAPEEISVEGKYRVVKMPVRFRNELASGDYPYPFWHSQKDWKSYERTTDLYLFFDGGKLVAACRSANTDKHRPHVKRLWDREWTWSDGQEPRASQYHYLFSPSNPHVERLETAYRRLAEQLQARTCTSCHEPGNPARMKRLSIQNYPAQILAGRHMLPHIVRANVMPPGVGMDPTDRADLIERAKELAAAGDEALAFEGETVSVQQ